MNRFILSGLVFASIIVISLGGKLCTPDQWEGMEDSIGGYVHHRRPGIILEHNFVAYDAKNERKASFITYVNNDYENKFQMIVRYGDDGDDSGRVYVVDLKKDKCWSKKLDKPFRKACIPEDAKKHATYYMGLDKAGLQVTGYLLKKKEMGVYLAVATAGDAIIPVTESVHGRFMTTSFIQGIGFANITPGIKNATVFDVPKQCKEDDDASVTEYLMREHFTLAI